jgi:hypothetical protein
MDLKDLTWDYAEPLKDDAWQARRLAEFFPFVADSLTSEDKALLLREIDKIHLPDERREIIRMVCTGEDDGKQDTEALNQEICRSCSGT